MTPTVNKVINLFILRGWAIVYFVTFILVVILLSAKLIIVLESPYPTSEIKNTGDALWWSVVGISTIGIGTLVPESPAGRYLTVGLMLVGILILSILTANIAAIFTEAEVKQDMDKELKILEGDINKVEKDIAGEIATEDSKIENELKELREEIRKDRVKS